MELDPSLVRDIAPTGRLRAALNMGNPVLARSNTSKEHPAGVTIDLARAFAAQLGLEVSFQEYTTAAHSGNALAAGDADIAFLAIDPKRAERIHFSAPYIEIEGAYLVRNDSPLHDNAEVDAAGMNVVVGDGSAYDLFLSRTLKHARLLKVPTSEQVVAAMLANPQAQVAAGVKQPLQADAARLGGVRLLPGRFMVIAQAMAMPKTRSARAFALMESFVEERKRTGAIADALARHGIDGAVVAA
jgi:polar amino acid transport system substrate-binding protein